MERKCEIYLYKVTHHLCRNGRKAWVGLATELYTFSRRDFGDERLKRYIGKFHMGQPFYLKIPPEEFKPITEYDLSVEYICVTQSNADALKEYLKNKEHGGKVVFCGRYYGDAGCSGSYTLEEFWEEIESWL